MKLVKFFKENQKYFCIFRVGPEKYIHAEIKADKESFDNLEELLGHNVHAWIKVKRGKNVLMFVEEAKESYGIEDVCRMLSASEEKNLREQYKLELELKLEGAVVISSDPSDWLLGAFGWKGSIKDHDYWSEINHRLAAEFYV